MSAAITGCPGPFYRTQSRQKQEWNDFDVWSKVNHSPYTENNKNHKHINQNENLYTLTVKMDRWASQSPGEPKVQPPQALRFGYPHQRAEGDAAVRPISLYACGRKNIRQKWAISPLFSLHNFPRSGTTSQPSLPHTHLRAQWAVSDLKDGGRKESQLF